MCDKVKVNGLYRFNPGFMDRSLEGVKPGDIVQVRNLTGCPPANTMHSCYIFKPEVHGKEYDGFIGMVFTGSLEKLT